MSSEDKDVGPEAIPDAKPSEAEAAVPADRPEARNSTAECNQSSSTKNEESNETKVPKTTTTIETESRENQSSYVASEEAKSQDLKGTTSGTIVESVSEGKTTTLNNDDEEREKDVEKFGGKIVYNPDGSAYIIDGDDNEDEGDDAVPALQDGSIVERSNNGGGKDGVSYPQIANAVYISNRRNHAAYYSALCARIQSKDNGSGVGSGAVSSQGGNSYLLLLGQTYPYTYS